MVHLHSMIGYSLGKFACQSYSIAALMQTSWADPEGAGREQGIRSPSRKTSCYMFP